MGRFPLHKVEGGPFARQSLVREDFDFDSGVEGELCDLDAGSGGEIGAEVKGVDFVDFGEVGHVGEIDGCFDDFSERAPRLFEKKLNVLEDQFGLLGDVAAVDFAGLAVNGNLAGEEDKVAGNYRGGIWPFRGRASLRSHNSLFHLSVPFDAVLRDFGEGFFDRITGR